MRRKLVNLESIIPSVPTFVIIEVSSNSVYQFAGERYGAAKIASAFESIYADIVENIPGIQFPPLR
jgi:hypothetical protein